MERQLRAAESKRDEATAKLLEVASGSDARFQGVLKERMDWEAKWKELSDQLARERDESKRLSAQVGVYSEHLPKWKSMETALTEQVADFNKAKLAADKRIGKHSTPYTAPAFCARPLS